MTTDGELRDLLNDEASGPSGDGPGWDDVVRRGLRRQRIRRAQRGLLAALAVSAVVTGAVLTDADPTIETVPPAITATTATVGATPSQLPKITAARAQGAFVTVIAWAPERYDKGNFEPAFDLCADLHPRVAESPDKVVVELVDETAEQGLDWALCRHSRDSSTGLIELTDPLDDRTLLDAATGDAVPVIDGAQLLFPSALPAPFDVGRWDEYANSEEGSWTFAWMPRAPASGPGTVELHELRVTTGYGTPTECTSPREDVAVRGTTGRLCTGVYIEGLEDGGGVTYDLQWEEDGRTINVFFGSSDPARLTLDDILAIAEGLERLGG